MRHFAQGAFFILMTSSLLLGCEAIEQMVWVQSLKPDHRFEDVATPLAREYSDDSSWALLPSKANIDGESAGLPEARESQVDVFFVHPTTYFSPAAWNQPVDEPESERRLREWVLTKQASVFDECCRVYLPKYRQATLFSVISDHPDGDKAMALAYQDIARAFDEFIASKNQGRPFIIASHSQGSWHALRLIEEKIAGTDLQALLVIAYLIGFPLPMDKVSESSGVLPLCHGPQDTSCIVTWNTISTGADTRFYREYARLWYRDHYEENAGKALACVNPIGWRNHELPARQGEYLLAQCRQGMLEIPELNDARFQWFLFGAGNYHMHDYDLFSMSIRANAMQRIQAFLSAYSPE